MKDLNFDNQKSDFCVLYFSLDWTGNGQIIFYDNLTFCKFHTLFLSTALKEEVMSLRSTVVVRRDRAVRLLRADQRQAIRTD